MQERKRKQTLLVILGAISIILIAAMLLKRAVNLGFQGGLDGQDDGYRNVTFTDAVTTCHREARLRFGKEIRNLVTDNHSSRFESRASLYKIFLQIDLFPEASDEASRFFYVNCFVRAKNGSIRKFESFEKAEGLEGSSHGDKTNMFGIPIKD